MWRGVVDHGDARHDLFQPGGVVGGGIIHDDHLEGGVVVRQKQAAERQIGDADLVMRGDDDRNLRRVMDGKAQRFELGPLMARFERHEGMGELRHVGGGGGLGEMRAQALVAMRGLGKDGGRKGACGFALQHLGGGQDMGQRADRLVEGLAATAVLERDPAARAGEMLRGQADRCLGVKIEPQHGQAVDAEHGGRRRVRLKDQRMALVFAQRDMCALAGMQEHGMAAIKEHEIGSGSEQAGQGGHVPATRRAPGAVDQGPCPGDRQILARAFEPRICDEEKGFGVAAIVAIGQIVECEGDMRRPGRGGQGKAQVLIALPPAPAVTGRIKSCALRDDPAGQTVLERDDKIGPRAVDGDFGAEVERLRGRGQGDRGIEGDEDGRLATGDHHLQRVAALKRPVRKAIEADGMARGEAGVRRVGAAVAAGGIEIEGVGDQRKRDRQIGPVTGREGHLGAQHGKPQAAGIRAIGGAQIDPGVQQEQAVDRDGRGDGGGVEHGHGPLADTHSACGRCHQYHFRGYC